MSFEPRLIKTGERARAVKRGATGPAPARRLTLWDTAAARKGALEIRAAATGELLSSAAASQEQLGTYVAMKCANVLEAAERRGIDLTKSAGRRWLRRTQAGLRGDWVRRMTAA